MASAALVEPGRRDPIGSVPGKQLEKRNRQGIIFAAVFLERPPDLHIQKLWRKVEVFVEVLLENCLLNVQAISNIGIAFGPENRR